MTTQIFPIGHQALLAARSWRRHYFPALIVAARDPTASRYVEFFTTNIRDPRTRRAYAIACRRFFEFLHRSERTL